MLMKNALFMLGKAVGVCGRRRASRRVFTRAAVGRARREKSAPTQFIIPFIDFFFSPSFKGWHGCLQLHCTWNQFFTPSKISYVRRVNRRFLFPPFPSSFFF